MITSATKNIVKTEEALQREFLIVSESNMVDDVSLLFPAEFVQVINFQRSLFCFLSYQWYFVSKIVLAYCEKNCSSEREKVLKFEAEGQEFAKFEQCSERSDQLLKQNTFLTCSWRFLRSNILKQL